MTWAETSRRRSHSCDRDFGWFRDRAEFRAVRSSASGARAVQHISWRCRQPISGNEGCAIKRVIPDVDAAHHVYRLDAGRGHKTPGQRAK